MASGNGGGKAGAALVLSTPQKFEVIKSGLTNKRGDLVQLMPRHLQQNPDKLLRCVTTAISRTPELLDCSLQSIILATASSCALGLEPNTHLQLAYLIPFKNKKAGNKLEAQFMIGYRGIIRLAIQSGEVSSMRSRTVRGNDDFKLRYGLHEDIDHIPLLNGPRGDVIGAYSVAVMRGDNGYDFEFMSREEIDGIRARSQSGNDGPWVTDFSEMARKTPTRRHGKRLPLSSELLAKAVTIDEKQDLGQVTRNDIEDVLGKGFVDVYDEMVGEVVEQPQDRGEALANKV